MVAHSTGSESLSLPLPITGKLKGEWSQFQISGFVQAWDGLRALALFGPMFSHIRPVYLTPIGDAFSECGVTIFLLMSGILTTNSLQKAFTLEGNQNLGSRAQIWISLCARFVRIFPALFLAIVLYTLAELVRSGYHQKELPSGYWKNVLNTILYLSDIEPFGPHPANPWKNTWTVAVMEKWYILWIIFLPMLFRSRMMKYICNLLVVFCLILMTLNLLVYSNTLKIPFFGYDGFLGQGWKWLYGALIPLIHLPGWMQNRRAFSIGFSLMLFLAIFGQILQARQLIPITQKVRLLQFKFINELFSPLSAMLMLFGSAQGNRILESKPMRFLGRISYSWYLMQVPICIFNGWPRHGWVGVQDTTLAFAISLFSTFYIEEPIREWYKGR